MSFIKGFLVAILTLESRLVIRKYRPFIVAVTGSVGKTSAKDAIYCVIKDTVRFCRKSEKSMNSEIGLPLTIIGVPNAWHNPLGWIRNVLAGLSLIFYHHEYPDCLILEIGADHPGDIRKTVKWLRPDIAVITKISSTPVHVEFFKSPEQVFEEKASLAMAVKPGGALILFADNERVVSLSGRLAGKNVNVVTYGMSDKAMIGGTDEKTVYVPDIGISGLSFIIQIDGISSIVNVPNVLGRTCIYPILAAAAVAKARGLSVEKIVESLRRYEAPRGRMNVIPGIHGSLIIDDTYNSSPDAALAALETLRGLSCSGSKIAVLGDMMELGRFSSDEHRRIGKEAAKVAAELVTVGQRSRLTGDEAVRNGLPDDLVHSFDTAFEAAEYLVRRVSHGDIILVKGSQSMRMERAVRALLKEPEKADRLLVRQEKEWLNKK